MIDDITKVAKTESADRQPNDRVPIEERAKKLGKEELFAALQLRVRNLERQMYTAYKIPTEKVKADISSQVLDELLKIARDAREFSDQYRDFNVGGAVLGIRKTYEATDNPWFIMFDANTKPTEKSQKHCSELYLMDRIEAAGEEIQEVLTFAVVGEPQQDDDSKMKQITLTPCKLCRDRMSDMAESVSPIDGSTVNEGSPVSLETEVITADARDLNYRKYQKVKDLHKFHKEKNGSIEL